MCAGASRARADHEERGHVRRRSLREARRTACGSLVVRVAVGAHTYIYTVKPSKREKEKEREDDRSLGNAAGAASGRARAIKQ